MKIARIAAYFFASIALFAVSANAQRTKRPVRKPPVTAAKPFVSPDEKAAKLTASNQFFNLNNYLGKFAPVAPGLDDLAKDERAGKLSKRAAADFLPTKRKISIQLRDFTTGLAALESSFRTKPTLAKYLPKIQGITDLSTASEDSAAVGKYTAARDSLRIIVQKLTDTIAVMPN